MNCFLGDMVDDFLLKAGCCSLGKFMQWDADGGEQGAGKLPDWRVIETRDRYVFGHSLAESVQLTENHGAYDIVDADEGIVFFRETVNFRVGDCVDVRKGKAVSDGIEIRIDFFAGGIDPNQTFFVNLSQAIKCDESRFEIFSEPFEKVGDDNVHAGFVFRCYTRDSWYLPVENNAWGLVFFELLECVIRRTMECEDEAIGIASFFMGIRLIIPAVGLADQMNAAMFESGLDTFDKRGEIIEERSLRLDVAGEYKFNVQDRASTVLADVSFFITHQIGLLLDFRRECRIHQTGLV